MQKIIIRQPRMLIVLKESEILDMLKKCPDVWANSLKRGKGLSRLEKSMNRK